jgi:hypothetical protein
VPTVSCQEREGWSSQNKPGLRGIGCWILGPGSSLGEEAQNIRMDCKVLTYIFACMECQDQLPTSSTPDNKLLQLLPSQAITTRQISRRAVALVLYPSLPTPLC